MNINTEPKLDPPGAGLPKVELYIARFMFGWRRWRGDRNSINAHFQKEREIIRELARSCDVESGSQRVLVKRPRGLEDSSRYWSVWMALDHLRIVHHSIIRIIDALARGVSLKGAASTAAVKPNPDVSAAIVADYEKSCDDLLSVVAATADLNTEMRYAHPWFGPLNAAGWHALAAGHIGIHRVQIERIIKGIGVKSMMGV